MLMEEKTLDSNQIYEGRRLGLRVDRVMLPGGRETTREVVEHGDCVAVVALDANEDIILVRQFRHAVGQELLEIPAGGIEHGEEPVEGAVRELEEETGYKAGTMERIGGFYASPGYCSEYLHLFFATDLEPGPPRAMSDEIIEVVTVPLSQVGGLVASGELRDSKSIAGILALLLRRGECQL